MLKIWSTVFVFFAFAPQLFSQQTGQAVFDEQVLHQITLTFEAADWEQNLEQDFNAAPIGDVPYRMAQLVFDGVILDSIGARFKGFTSFDGNGRKRPFKLDFNEFVSGKKLDGLRKLNLNNATADASLHRDPIAYRLHNQLGVPAPRTAFAQLTVNGESFGVYQLIEQIDRTFLENHYSDDEGNLFKNLGWSKLEDLGAAASAYQNAFKLKTNEDENDWSGFVDFVLFLNRSSDSEFAAQIEEKFNVDQFLRALAVDVALNNWDAYLEHGRNYYLYEDRASGVFNWIPWDYNFSLPTNSNSTCDFEVFPSSLTDGTPTVKFFNVSDPDTLSSTVEWLFSDGMTSPYHNTSHTFSDAGFFDARLTVTDQNGCSSVSYLFGNTTDDQTSCGALQGPNAPELNGEFGIAVSTWYRCCDDWSGFCQAVYRYASNRSLGVFFNGGSGFGDSNFEYDQRSNEGVLIRRILAVPRFYDRYLNYACSFTGGEFDAQRLAAYTRENRLILDDAVRADPLTQATYDDYDTSLGPEGIQETILTRQTALRAELDSIANCRTTSLDISSVVINEIAASVDSLSEIADAAGQYDDWVELFNTSNVAVDLSGACLSDNRAIPCKWRLPESTVIDPEGYLSIWADKGTGQPGLHAKFRLKRSGDQVYLSNSMGAHVDSVAFLEQTTNLSYARIPNGTGDFVIKTPTFEGNNESSSSISESTSFDRLVAFPNPASDMLYVRGTNLSQGDQFYLHNSAGQLVLTGSAKGRESNIDVSKLSPGVYSLSAKQSTGVAQTRFVVSR